MTAYNVVSPTSLMAGQPEDVAVVLANLQAIAAVINGALDNANLSPGAAIVASKLAGFPSDSAKVLKGDGSWATISIPSSLPTGGLMMWPAAAAPTDWLLCDGASLDRTTYAALFAVIGVTYGSVDGTHFTLPDFRGRMPVGKGTNALVNALGNNEGVAEANRRPKHRHTPHLHTYETVGGAGAFKPYGGSAQVGNFNTSSSDGGSGVATDPLVSPAYLVLNYIIKAT